MIFELQEEGTGGGTEDVIARDVTIFPRNIFYIVKGRIALLAGRDQNGRWAGARG